MKIVVIGGTGLIGSKTVERLRLRGHEAIAASPSSGVNTVTGEGVRQVIEGASVVVDLANSPSFDDQPAMDFFQASGRHLLEAGIAAGVQHHIALSVVGTDRLLASGYFRAKQAQEDMIRKSGLPFTIIHSTQFFEFAKAIVESGSIGNEVHLPPTLFQPIAADDVGQFVAEAALDKPANRIVEIGGPDRIRMSDFAMRYMTAMADRRSVVADPAARYFGLDIDDRSLVPGADARVGAMHFDQWLAVQRAPVPAD